MLVESEELILKDLKERDIKSPPDRERALLRALATSQILLRFERVYGLIWASQLTCLRYLNQREHGADLSEIVPLYELAKSGYPSWYENYPYERWLGFLRDLNLIIWERDSRLFITVAGRSSSNTSWPHGKLVHAMADSGRVLHPLAAGRTE